MNPVPEDGLPPAPPTSSSELKRPHPLTSTNSESFLTVFRDGHHKPAHRHNDMAHKCGLPYTIPRSHTIHATSNVARRSVDQLPSQTTLSGNNNSSQRAEPLTNVTQRQARSTSEHGSPESAPATALEDTITPIPPLELSSLVDRFPSASPPHEPSSDGSPGHTSVLNTVESIPRDQVVSSVPPLDVSLPTFPATTSSPTACVSFQDSNQDAYFASEPDTALSSAALNAPPVDWSSFPLYSSDVPAPTSTQAPSYASLDFGSISNGLPAPSSSGDLSELDEVGPLPGFGNGGADLHDEGSNFDPFHSSPASVGLPQTELLSSNNLDSLNIDDFLKSTNESTAALEQQLHANMGMEPKSLTSQSTYGMQPAETYKALPMPISTATPTGPVWSAALFEAMSTPREENMLPQTWA